MCWRTYFWVLWNISDFLLFPHIFTGTLAYPALKTVFTHYFLYVTIIGKNVTFEMEVLEIKTRLLPNWDDNLAGQIRENLTIAQLEEQVHCLYRTCSFLFICLFLGCAQYMKDI